MDDDGDFTSLKGQLLIASASLVDPNFHRTVVLVTEHAEEGAMGVVLNRRSSISVSEAVPHLGSLTGDDDWVYLGGPVQPEAVVALAELEDESAAAALAFGEVGFLPSDADPDEIAPAVRRVRVFAGYAGWAAGQLESELEESAWILEPAEPEDVFSSAPESLWSEVLRRKGGPYAVLALMPPDPSMN